MSATPKRRTIRTYEVATVHWLDRGSRWSGYDLTEAVQLAKRHGNEHVAVTVHRFEVDATGREDVYRPGIAERRDCGCGWGDYCDDPIELLSADIAVRL